ncbi:MAG: alpha/beta hydrolase fold domain-containing protein, partial [Opitutales bacterium]
MRPLLLLFVAVSVFAADDTKLRIHELGKPGADKLADLPARYANFMSHGYGASMPNPVFRLSDLVFLPEGRRERLDLYVSYRRDFKVRRPGVLFIHGGGFTGGDKAEYRTASVSADLARAGYVVVSCNYVLGPKDKAGVWPRNIADCRDAVRWMRANADALGLDPDRIAVAGGSAGGYLALM